MEPDPIYCDFGVIPHQALMPGSAFWLALCPDTDARPIIRRSYEFNAGLFEGALEVE